MLTSNGELLRRLEALNRQWEDTQAEIDLRVKQKRVDNDGYLLTEGQSGQYSLVSKDYYIETMTQMVNNMKAKCKCKE